MTPPHGQRRRDTSKTRLMSMAQVWLARLRAGAAAAARPTRRRLPRRRPASGAFRGPCSSTSRDRPSVGARESGARPSAEWGTRYSGSGELGQEFQRVENLVSVIRQFVSCQLQGTTDNGQRTNGCWQSGSGRGEALVQVAALEEGLYARSTIGRQKPYLAANRSS